MKKQSKKKKKKNKSVGFLLGAALKSDALSSTIAKENRSRVAAVAAVREERRTPAPLLAKLTSTRIVEEVAVADDECVICLESVYEWEYDDDQAKNWDPNGPLTVLRLGCQCSSLYHRKCIEVWFLRHKLQTCPLCEQNADDIHTIKYLRPVTPAPKPFTFAPEPLPFALAPAVAGAGPAPTPHMSVRPFFTPRPRVMDIPVASMLASPVAAVRPIRPAAPIARPITTDLANTAYLPPIVRARSMVLSPTPHQDEVIRDLLAPKVSHVAPPPAASSALPYAPNTFTSRDDLLVAALAEWKETLPSAYRPHLHHLSTQ